MQSSARRYSDARFCAPLTWSTHQNALAEEVAKVLTQCRKRGLHRILQRLAWDLKTVHAGGADYWSARARDDGQCGAVAELARRVQGDYERHAASVDRAG